MREIQLISLLEPEPSDIKLAEIHWVLCFLPVLLSTIIYPRSLWHMKIRELWSMYPINSLLTEMPFWAREKWRLSRINFFLFFSYFVYIFQGCFRKISKTWDPFVARIIKTPWGPVTLIIILPGIPLEALECSPQNDSGLQLLQKSFSWNHYNLELVKRSSEGEETLKLGCSMFGWLSWKSMWTWSRGLESVVHIGYRDY